ncbi:Multidrug resistance protein mexA precursor [Delftia tsuruhatensis]|uniref:efflux RND transporter periplasmic adaptor subunit n=1 Tax=Delftia tsuruhatensis TaxID=180282 RepID=UPI001E6F6D56|nr:efflux RND transporter periplasmic adaptor subunit [Delftia tsuruhatensis]CAB5719499.1 Multidrug resistance protein mexA precursor [Delftia tsuruhatensis]CAC9687939.1 Multidrug resistance protein mexA precursor [Delftia tsuruhatensis]
MPVMPSTLAAPALPRHHLLAPLCLAVALALGACSKAEPPPEPVRAVKLLTVGVGTLDTQLEYAGEVRARIESRLGFRVAGKIVRREVELGQHVQAGQLLARLDASDYRLGADAARAQVAAATTQRDLAAADVRRYSQLKAQNFISGAELERREASLKSAQATLDQAKAQLASQSNQEAYAQLLADVPGVVTGIDAEPGQVVSAGSPVVRIAQDGPRDVVFVVPEDKRGEIRVGQKVSVRPWSAGMQPLQGQVREVAASADPVTRTYQVKVSLPTADAAAVPPLGATVHALPEGMGPTGQPVIKLPTTALRQEGGGGQGTAVWVFDAASSTVKLQPVQLATADGNEAVIAAGLTPGMQVVATGVHVLTPGQKVTVYQDRYDKTQQPAQPAQAPAAAGAAPSGAAR